MRGGGGGGDGGIKLQNVMSHDSHFNSWQFSRLSCTGHVCMVDRTLVFGCIKESATMFLFVCSLK